MPEWSVITQAIETALGHSLVLDQAESVAGGCINAAYVLHFDSRACFVKLHRAESLPMFEAEAEGLKALADSDTLAVPRPLCCGVAGADAYLAMEYCDLHPHGDPVLLGERLAAMHRHHAPRFGWHRDNTIGSTLQPNRIDEVWPRFWASRRLGFQLQRAKEQGANSQTLDKGERLLALIPAFFNDYTPAASLLHGDLWSGNVAYTADGSPVIFDPAVYYGDRETDLAMTELFGGFPASFYKAYQSAYPLDPGYAVRKRLYNLYHILNHFNLFGGGYLQQAEDMMTRLLVEVE